MRQVQLLDYIKGSIEDEYAMGVLYYCIKDAALKNDLAFKNVSSFFVNGKFHGKPIQIGLNSRMKPELKTIGLLLSVRALMLDKDYLTCCSDDNLIFTASPLGKFQWIEYATIIMECMKDDEFADIYDIFEEVYFEEELPDGIIDELRNKMEVPEYRNEEKYYMNVASENTGVTDEVICNNAFVEKNFEEYNVPENVAYIGNTAFSFCPNLTILRFSDKVSFGKFPIIECNNLKRIVVPTDFVDYFKEELPHYKNIICDNEEKELSDVAEPLSSTENNKGKRWTISEEEKIKHFFGLGHSFKAIANAMGRTEVAIKARLGKLGLIDYTYTKDDISIPDKKEEDKEDPIASLADAIGRAKSFTSFEQYFNLFKSYSIDLPEALEILFLSNNVFAVYSLVKIAGDDSI